MKDYFGLAISSFCHEFTSINRIPKCGARPTWEEGAGSWLGAQNILGQIYSKTELILTIRNLEINYLTSCIWGILIRIFS
jgi:hypothetical protein